MTIPMQLVNSKYIPILAACLLLVASPARATDDTYVPIPLSKPCAGSVNIITGHDQCSGTCRGITVIVRGERNCRGEDGDDNGQDGGDGCQGTTILLPWTDNNCQGGDGGDGDPAGDGGDGCTGYTVNLGYTNCIGGDGGDGDDGDDGGGGQEEAGG